MQCRKHAKLDIAEHRRPQDGRISLYPEGRRELDIRVAVLPTVDGEGVVMRLLEKARSAPTLNDIGLSFQMQMDIERLNHTSLGAFLVTGPTGSGKSTTLYAALDDINRPGINVITVEDPVEYRLSGIFQVEIHPRAGLTFAGALRGVLRADPDVIMIGEISAHRADAPDRHRGRAASGERCRHRRPSLNVSCAGRASSARARPCPGRPRADSASRPRTRPS